MSNKVVGRVIHILSETSGISKAGKEWKKQEFVIETAEEQFPKKICFTLFGDKVSMTNSFQVGSDVEVSYNLESNETNGRWYHNVNAWKVDVVNKPATDTSAVRQRQEVNNPPSPEVPDESDLPF